MSSQNFPPLGLLHRVLSRQKILVSMEALEKASVQANVQLPDDAQAPAWVRLVLTGSRVANIQAAMMPWRLFDTRRMPALVLWQGQWFLAERTPTGEFVLNNVQGDQSLVSEGLLVDAQVLWMRSAERRLAVAGSVLKGNRAAQWVMQALFSEPAWVAKVVMATLVVNALALSTSLFAMQVYDRVVPTLAYATLTTLVAGMAVVVVLDWGLKTLRARILDSVSVSVDKRVSQQVFEHLLHLRLDIQPKSLGTLAAQVGGLESVRQFFSSSVIFGLVDLPFALLFIVFIAVVGGQVAWVYAGLLPVALALGWVSQLRLRRLLLQQMHRQNERQGLLVDAIRGAESIRAGNASWRFADEWQAVTASIDGYNIQQKAIHNFTTVTTNSLSSLAYVAAVVVGVWQIEAGLLTMGGMIACSILGGRVIAPISQGVQYMTQWQHVQQSLSMVNQILTLELERRSEQALLMIEEVPRSLEVEQLRYSYPESPVQQLNVGKLRFQAGERVLLVGPVGCGKSTLLKILAGLYPPSNGRVRLGDADLWEIDPQVVVSHVGYLPQQVHLFKGNLKSNLALSGTASDSRVMRITRDLGVDRIAAASPLGMDLVINEGGEGLSGGQRQLVALARVVINQPKVWLLDEPTASLDAETEERVWEVLADQVQPNDILIVATHRPMQALKLATRIIVMAQGEVLKDDKPERVAPQMFARSKTQRSSKPAASRVDGGLSGGAGLGAGGLHVV